MKLLKRKCSWLAITNFILIAFLFGAFCFWHERTDFKPLLTKEEYYRPRSSMVNTWNQNFSVNCRNICLQTKTYLLLLVLSIPSHLDRRNAIRETWTNSKSWPNFKISLPIKPVFLFGKYADSKYNDRLVKESMEYGDIVVGNFVDTYRNLTLKVLTGLDWVRRYCAGATYVAKMDDDTFINVPLLYKLLETWPLKNHTILGYVVGQSRTERKGKYQVSYESYPFNFYPQYTTGNMYIATPETFFTLLDVAPYQPRIDMEDVFITGILAKIAQVRHRTFSHGMYLSGRAAPVCDFVKNIRLYSQDYGSKDVWKAWTLITKSRDKCKW